MIDAKIRDANQKMDQVLTALASQLTTLHVGRASVSLVDGILVEHYGTKMPIKQLGSITVPEANQLVITPWDKTALGPIETAIRGSDLGVNPINDGEKIRIVLPPLTAERRAELVKVVNKMAEEARIALRSARHEAWEAIVAAQKSGSLTEDDRDRARKELDELINRMNQRVEETAKEKEAELLAI